nr:ClassD_beta_lactamase [uncultured bacterium]
MKNKLYTFSFLLFHILFLIIVSCSAPVGDHRDDFKRYFDEFHVTGCFVMYDLENSKFTDYNPDRCAQRFIPASTFKIFNSLVALETKAIPDENYVIKWDGVLRNVPAWNHDQTMTEAIKNSTVWYYQEVARKIGEERMQQWLNLVHYGNRQMGSTIDSFWLNGDLRISADEQIEFLKNLYTYQLPFSKRSMEIVKKILVRQDSLGYKLSFKTGLAIQDTTAIGWNVGYIETKGNIYFFAMNIEAPKPLPENFAIARRMITERCLKELGVL